MPFEVAGVVPCLDNHSTRDPSMTLGALCFRLDAVNVYGSGKEGSITGATTKFSYALGRLYGWDCVWEVGSSPFGSANIFSASHKAFFNRRLTASSSLCAW
jgi:hypothetical protein